MIGPQSTQVGHYVMSQFMTQAKSPPGHKLNSSLLSITGHSLVRTGEATMLLN
jgi:hypothetical protein